MDTGAHPSVTQDVPPRGYVSLSYASSAGQRSAVVVSHGRIFGLLCGSIFLTGWFVVSTVGTVALAVSPSFRNFVFSSLLSKGDLPAKGAAAVVSAPSPERTQAVDAQAVDLPVPPLERLPSRPSTEIASRMALPQPPVKTADAKAGRPASAPEVTRFDRTQVETSHDKLEFRFFLNLLQKGKKQTGHILARAQFRTTSGKILSVASTLEGGGVYSGNDPETGIPFTMRHAVRHDLVFLAPEDTEGKFIGVTAKANPAGGGAVSSVSLAAP